MGCLLWSCTAVSTSSRQNVKLGDPQVKTSLKALDNSQEAASGPPAGQTGIQISKKDPSSGRGVWPSDKKISPISLQQNYLGRKSSLQPLGISLLKWNSRTGGALASVSTTFFSHYNKLGHIFTFLVFFLFYLKNTYFYWDFITWCFLVLRRGCIMWCSGNIVQKFHDPRQIYYTVLHILKCIGNKPSRKMLLWFTKFIQPQKKNSFLSQPHVGSQNVKREVITNRAISYFLVLYFRNLW